MKTLLKLAQLERSPDTAFAELLRRHVLPVVKESDGQFSATFGGSGDKDGVMKALQAAARGQDVPPKTRQTLRDLKRLYMGVKDNELMASAREDNSNQRALRVIERLVRENG